MVIAFLFLISIGILNDFFGFYKVAEVSEAEKRRPEEKPIFNVSNLDPYPKKYDRYFTDHFPFRQELIKTNAFLSYFIFHKSPLPDEVSLGKNGWLFFHQKELAVYSGKHTLTDIRINGLVNILRNRTLHYRAKGIHFYVAYAPINPDIYPEFLPVRFSRAPGGTVTDKIVRAIKADTVIPFIDLKEVLLATKTHEQLYYKTDNHWNWQGSWAGYQALMKRIAKDVPKVRPLTTADFYFGKIKESNGNLATMVGLYGMLSETVDYPVFYYQRSQQMEPGFQRPGWAKDIPNFESVWATGDTTLPVCLVIGDSFTDWMRPFLSESFDKTVYIFDGWTYRQNDEVIDQINPDIVLLLIFEPHVSHLIDNW